MLYPSAPGTKIFTNKHASIDYSNKDDGYITVEYFITDKHCKTKLIKNGEEIVYDTFGATVIPFNLGEGKYTVKTYVQAAEPTKYITAEALEIDVKFREKDIVFRYPNQRVNYTPHSKVVAKAAELCKNAKTQGEKLSAYMILSLIILHMTQIKRQRLSPGICPTLTRRSYRKKVYAAI